MTTHVIPRSIHVWETWPGGYGTVFGWVVYCDGVALHWSKQVFYTPDKARADAIAQFDNIVNFYTICKCGVSKSLPESAR